MTISIGELQKNISILKKIKEPLIVVDKRSNEEIVRIEPLRKKQDDMELFNELISDLKPESKIATREDFEKVYTEHLKEKYGFN